MKEASEATPETSTPDVGSTRDATLGRFILWGAVGIGVIAAFNAIGNAALRKQREAQLERVAPRRSGSPPLGSAAPAGPPVPPVQEGLYGPKPWAVHESRAELERGWKMDEAVRDRQRLPGDPTTKPGPDRGRY